MEADALCEIRPGFASRCDGFVFQTSMVGEGVKAYVDLVALPGEQVLWELDYYITLVGIKDWTSYKKQCLKRGTFNNIADSWGLTADSWMPPNRERGFPSLVFATVFLLPWLLHVFKKPGKHDGTRLTRVAAVWANLIQMVRDGAALTRQALRLEFLDEALGVSGSGVVLGFDKLLGIFPDLAELWERVERVLASARFVLAPMHTATIVDWAIFSSMALPMCTKDGLRNHLAALMRAANSLSSWCLEQWIFLHYFSHMNGREQLRVLRSATGRRRKVDQLEKEQLIHRLRKAHGSSNSFVSACTEHSSLDHQLTLATIAVFVANVQSKFKSARNLSLCWDPGSYGGLDYNVGMCWSSDLRVAAVLPICAPWASSKM